MVEAICWERRISSVTAITETSEEFLTIMIASLTSGGSTRRNICGIRMRRRIAHLPIPSMRAASISPFGIASSPAR